MTIFSILPYWPKKSSDLKVLSWAISGARPITYTSVFYITLRFANFFTFSLVNELIGILFYPFLTGAKPNDLRDLTQLKD